VRELDIKHSDFSYTDQTANPNYKLFINDIDLTLKNLSNHQRQGPADVSLHGKFMGSGDTNVSGTFLARRGAPASNLKIALVNTDLPSLNDLLRAFGRFDVAAGSRSITRASRTSGLYTFIRSRRRSRKRIALRRPRDDRIFA